MPELTVADVKKLMSKFTYKPNFTFRVIEDQKSFPGDSDIVVKVVMHTLDSTLTYPPGRAAAQAMLGQLDEVTENGAITIDSVRPHIPETVLKAGEDVFWQWLHDDVIGFLEHHELDEWFQVDGKPVYGPHNPSLTAWADKQAMISLSNSDGLLTRDVMTAKLTSLAMARRKIEGAVDNLRQTLHDHGVPREAIDAIPGLQPPARWPGPANNSGAL
jgi:hypothetical protein